MSKTFFESLELFAYKIFGRNLMVPKIILCKSLMYMYIYNLYPLYMDSITCSTPLLATHLRDLNPDPSVFCSTMSTVPATSGLLNKMKLPFAIHIHPFKDSKAKVSIFIIFIIIFKDLTCTVCRIVCDI